MSVSAVLPESPSRPLGIVGVYWFLASEAALFGGLLGASVYLRSADPVWAEAAHHLSGLAAGVATACLLAGTWSLRAAASLRWSSAPAALVGAAAAGVLFLLVKLMDYWGHWSAGLKPAASAFWATFYLLTGVHALHVFAGVCVAVWLAWTLRGRSTEATVVWLEGIRAYWYFVDVVWLSLLAFFYVR